MKPIIVIPAYKPDEALYLLLQALTERGESVILVNDGSSPSFDDLFGRCEKLNQVTLLHHAVNLGKGQALKTAFDYFLRHEALSQSPGVITADADGQHSLEDILRLSEAFTHTPQRLCLGARNFEHNVPFRSRFGNNLTKTVFRLLIGHTLQDTQTGLRGIPRSLLPRLIKSSSNGYEFELDMLVICAKQKIKFLEIPIQTIYKNHNKGSHFNPLIDSVKIYFVFLRFLTFSLVSGLLDLGAFLLVFFLCDQIFLSEFTARVFSGTCNFFFNKKLVFQSQERFVPEALKYALLCLVNLLFSYGLITSLVFVGFNLWMSKLLALTGLFLGNFAIQKVLVFEKSEDAKAAALR